MALSRNAKVLLTTAVSGAGVMQKSAAVDAKDAAGLPVLISRALRRGLTAKFFATLGAEGELGRDLQVVCREAKRQNMRIEYLIIAFKDAWRALPEARTLPQGLQGQEFLSRVITQCIAEYYRSAQAD